MEVKKKIGGQWVADSSPLKTDVTEVIMHGVQYPDPAESGEGVFTADAAGAKAKSTSSLAASGVAVKIPVAGSYKFYWNVYAMYSGSSTSQLYKNGSAVGTQRNTSEGTAATYTETLDCDVGDTIEIYLKGAGSSSKSYGVCGGLFACIDWDNGF